MMAARKGYVINDFSNAPIKIGEAAKWYGYSDGLAGKKRFLKYVTAHERMVGKEIIDRSIPHCWRISPVKVEQYLPELAAARNHATRTEKLRTDIGGFVERLKGDLEKTIGESSRFVELERRVAKLESLLSRLISTLKERSR